ncbi:MAG: sigma-70 family RNA polymerase sigma factor [Myxococcota bacterium]|nr:sigma-70 family RNA polymerase sigma factor [Myxococcota bacterium]
MTSDEPGRELGAEGAGRRTSSVDSSFPVTRWSLVRRAGGADGGSARAALGTLVRQYARPVRAYVRAGGWAATSEDAEDLVQDFFVTLIEKRTVGRAERQRGCFRNFLKAALRHFLLHEYERRRAQKRTGSADPGRRLPQDVPDLRGPWPPEEALDREWGRQVLRDALGDVERELAGESKPLYFRVLQLRDLGDDVPSYAEIAAALRISESDVRNYLHVARTRLRRLVRLRIRDTVEDEANVESELRCLFG